MPLTRNSITRRLLRGLGLSTALVGVGAAALRVQSPRYDVIVRGGTVFDGTGGASQRADIGIRGRHISRIGDLGTATAPRVIDAGGLLVAPGFINLHSHAEPGGLPIAENMLTQGVTTEILNADGSGPLDITRQLRAVDSMGLAVNVGANIGFNSIWSSVVGPTDRRATSDEIARMRQYVVDNLAAGAFGVSSGLDYKPAYFATTDEVVAVLEAARPYRTNFPNHDRLTPESGFSSRAGIRETIAIGERAGLTPVATHIKAQGHEQGQASLTTTMMAEATARGVYTAADVYPYLAGMTGLGALIIPAWAVDGGTVEMRKRFADPLLRERIVREADAAIKARFNGHDDILVLSTRRQLKDYMAEFGVSSPGEAVVRILQTESPGAIMRFGAEGDLVRLLQYPSTAVSCDCGATARPTGHPRNYGTFPRVLGRYVREGKQLTWADAIRRMSGLPAALVGLTDRGFIAPGMAADLVVFDSATIIDHATYEEPARLSEGVRHVLVNGRVALTDGRLTGELAGRALQRHPGAPSHPLAFFGTRRLVLNTPVTLFGDAVAPLADGAVQLVFQARQRRNERPLGTLTLSAAGRPLAVDAEFGLIDLWSGGGSVRGVLRQRGGLEERPFTLLLNRADPLRNNEPSVAFQLDGSPAVHATVPAGAIISTAQR
jgi:N-acyl-D-aspartate/D-glutamate deacylase